MDHKESERSLTAEEVRTSLRYYPSGKEGVFAFLLKSLALTLEVFLHTRIGERTLSIRKLLVGVAWIWLIAHAYLLFNLDWNWQFKIESTPPELHWAQVADLGPFTIKLPVFTESVQGVSILGMILFCYLSAASVQSIVLFVENRLEDYPHPNSSGEPFFIWDIFYRLFEFSKFKIDLVKQVCEPLLCSLSGIILIVILPSGARSSILWLFMASGALFIRAMGENRKRKDLFLDALAAQMDAEALSVQRLSLDGEEVESFDRVPLFNNLNGSVD